VYNESDLSKEQNNITVTIKDKIRQLQSIDVNALTDAAIIENKDSILDANRSQMYDRGQIDVTRPDYREKYAASTIKQKRKKARFPKTDFITLKWEGDFHDSMKLLIFQDTIVIQADDLKWANWLEDRFSNALGLTEDSLKVIRDKVKLSFMKLLQYELR
jgi:hypothetical protein